MSVERDEKFWDFVAGRFERTEKRFAPLRAWAIENIKKHLDTDDFVLDYGCGPGTLTVEIAGSAKEILGIDISARMVELATVTAATRETKNASFAKATIFDQVLKTGATSSAGYDLVRRRRDVPGRQRRRALATRC